MFDYLVKDNNLKPVMKQHGLVLPEDLNFIKEQINGPLNSNTGQEVNIWGCGWTGRASHSIILCLTSCSSLLFSSTHAESTVGS